MKHLKVLGLAAVAAMAFTAFAASTASATTLEVGGVTQNGTVTITMSLEPGTSLILSRTDGSLSNTCTTSHGHGTTSTFTGTHVTGGLNSLTFEGCTRPVTVHNPGKLYIDHESSTTHGTVFSENADVTVSSPFGTVRCQTGAGTDIGTLTGTGDTSKHATLHVKAVLNCGFLLPSAKWEGSYTITSPTGLGVSV